MNIIAPSHEFLQEIDGLKMLRTLEEIGRICYKSEGKITETSYKPFLSRLIGKGNGWPATARRARATAITARTGLETS